MQQAMQQHQEDDPFRPAVFELLAQDKMRDLLSPALRFILATHAERYPRRLLLTLLNYHHTVYAAIMTLVELYYLKTWGDFIRNMMFCFKRFFLLMTARI